LREGGRRPEGGGNGRGEAGEAERLQQLPARNPSRVVGVEQTNGLVIHKGSPGWGTSYQPSDIGRPDVSMEIAEDEDDLIWRGNWRGARQKRGDHHLVESQHEEGIADRVPRVWSQPARPDLASKLRERDRRHVVQQMAVARPERMTDGSIDLDPRRLGHRY